MHVTEVVTPDVALRALRFACIGGQFTMDPKGAALAAFYVKARTVVPMLFQTFPLLAGSPKDLEAALKGKAKVLVLEPGKPVGF